MELFLSLLSLIGLGAFAWMVYDIVRTVQKARRHLKEEEKKMFEKLKKAMEDNIRKKQVEDDLLNVLKLIREDWNRSKVKSKLDRGSDKVIYRLDSGGLFEYSYEGRLEFTASGIGKITYKVGLTYQLVILRLIGTLVDDINAGRAKESNDPRSRRYYVLVDNIKLRKESLAKMRHDDPDRAALENELRAAEKKAAEMKKSLINI